MDPRHARAVWTAGKRSGAPAGASGRATAAARVDPAAPLRTPASGHAPRSARPRPGGRPCARPCLTPTPATPRPVGGWPTTAPGRGEPMTRAACSRGPRRRRRATIASPDAPVICDQRPCQAVHPLSDRRGRWGSARSGPRLGFGLRRRRGGRRADAADLQPDQRRIELSPHPIGREHRPLQTTTHGQTRPLSEPQPEWARRQLECGAPCQVSWRERLDRDRTGEARCARAEAPA